MTTEKDKCFFRAGGDTPEHSVCTLHRYQDQAKEGKFGKSCAEIICTRSEIADEGPLASTLIMNLPIGKIAPVAQLDGASDF